MFSDDNHNWEVGLCVVVVVQSLTHVQFFATLWIASRQAPLSFTISWASLWLRW